MAIDPTDNARDDARRIDNQKADRAADAKKTRSAEKNFNVQYQAKVKQKESDPSKNDSRDAGKEKHEQKGALLSRVLEVFKGKEEGENASKKEQPKNKDHDKKDDKEKRTDSRTETTTSSGGDHKRIDGGDQSSKQGGEGGGGQGGGSGSGSGGGGAGGGFGGGFGGQSGGQSGSGSGGGKEFSSSSGFSDQNFSGSLGGKSGTALRRAVSFVDKTDSSGQEGKGSGSGQFTGQHIDQIVEAVFLRVNDVGDKEMEIHLSDEVFSGLRFKATLTPQGVVISFACPTRHIKNQVLINRPTLYARLKEKNINIVRIDVI